MEFIGNKEQGLYAELQFMVDAYQYGVVCARPEVEQKFDFYAESKSGVKKIQVKCTQREGRRDTYKFNLAYGGGLKESYRYNEIDLFALYAMPIKTWWIIPIGIVINKKTIRLNLRMENYKKFINKFELI